MFYSHFHGNILFADIVISKIEEVLIICYTTSNYLTR